MIIKPEEGIVSQVAPGIAMSIFGIELANLRGTQLKMDADSKDIYKIDMANMYMNIVSTMYSLGLYYFGNITDSKPSVVMGGIPLWSTQEVSHGISELMMKYRATGGIFLAHQEGGEQTLRIQGKTWGPNRFLFLQIMDSLFIYGNSVKFDMFWKEIDSHDLDYIYDIATGTDKRETVTNPWTYYDKKNLDEGIEEKHLTFPVITKTRIYTNMYIETWEFIEAIENGMNVINFTIFLRKYITPAPYKYAKVKVGKDENGEEIAHNYYSKDATNEEFKKLRTIDTMVEIGYTGAMVLYRFFQYLYHNSPETNVAYITNIRLNNALYGNSNLGKKLMTTYHLDYDLEDFSTQQKEELMGID